MKRSKSIESFVFKNPRKWRPSLVLFAVAAFYLLFIALKSRHFLQIQTLDRLNSKPDPIRDSHPKPIKDRISYGRIASEIMRRRSRRFSWSGNLTKLESAARDAYNLGFKAWKELGDYKFNDSLSSGEKRVESCPSSVSTSGKKVMILPCGLEVGSAVTVVGMPVSVRVEHVTELEMRARGDGEGEKTVSQFMVELQGLKAVHGEDPPRILHFNPRLKGDWSGRPVIEVNTCYRMQWGQAMRCDGLSSEDDDETVDGYYKCEKWERSDIADLKESKTTSWLNRFIGRAKKPVMTWPFPFEEGKLFVLTLRAGMEGYHIYVGGRHITSFPYRMGYSLEDATGLAIKGNVNVQSVFATSLPKSHPSFSAQNALEMSEKWKSIHLPTGPVHLFIGILSATSHFAERMAVRKSWMQYPDIISSDVVARFFVALSSRKEVNALLKKEAEYFGDIVILPFMDHYELVVLKTIAICEYGTHNMTAAYIMKCDDDTFVRLDVILREINNIGKKSLYMGNLNLMHRPLRSGKWAVTYEEWPEDIYPPYANGPGYIISNDIASFVVSKHANQSLKMFKMEDVSMGMWVEEFNAYKKVKYLHSWKFCQFGCIENYYTAHYQSPRQMACLWDKLASGQAQCCNLR